MRKILPLAILLGLSLTAGYFLMNSSPRGEVVETVSQVENNYTEQIQTNYSTNISPTIPPVQNITEIEPEQVTPEVPVIVPIVQDNTPAETNTTPENITSLEPVISKTIKVANWNLQIFGDTKASKPELMNFYVSTLTNYDIAFVQEIRDADGSSFRDLCAMLTNYDCQVSSRAGRSTSKEQYGIIYKKGITAQVKDYNPDAQDRWERPPVEVLFDVEGYQFRAYNIHTKPEAVKSELASLEQIVSTNGNSIILGDLNADCDYYNNPANAELDSWNWVIGDQEDTTSSATDCTYDRIIMDADAYQEYVTNGVFKTGITKDVSDHYLVWVELKHK